MEEIILGTEEIILGTEEIILWIKEKDNTDSSRIAEIVFLQIKKSRGNSI